MHRDKVLVKEFGEMEKATTWRPRSGKKSGQAGRSVDLVQKMLGLCETENGTEIVELSQAGAGWHKRARENVGTKRFVEFRKRKCCRTEVHCLRKKVTLGDARGEFLVEKTRKKHGGI